MQSRCAYSALFLALAASAWQLSAAANAATIAPGNLVVYRVGDGQAALVNTGVAVFLDEYTTTGTLVQSLPVATTGSAQMVAIGNATTEGIISPSQDGTKLVFTGYRANTGTASLSTTASINKVIGTVDLSSTIDTSIAATDFGPVTPRSATTVDGTTYYASTSANVRYIASPGAASTSVSIDARNSRQVNLGDSVLYASNGSTTITQKVQSYGTLPTGTTAGTAVVTLALADAVNGFALFDLDAGVAGPDTLYALSTVESLLRKYSFDGTNWTASGSVASTAANLAGVSSGGTVTLYLTTGSALQAIVDASGYGVDITGTISSLATAGTNTAFRGIGILAIPEPASALLLLMALACARSRRRARPESQLVTSR